MQLEKDKKKTEHNNVSQLFFGIFFSDFFIFSL